MRISLWDKIVVAFLALNLLFMVMNFFKSDPVQITKDDIQHLLDQQRESIYRETNNTTRNEAIKVMDNVHVLLRDTTKYDSLRAAAFGL